MLFEQATRHEAAAQGGVGSAAGEGSEADMSLLKNAG